MALSLPVLILIAISQSETREKMSSCSFEVKICLAWVDRCVVVE